MKKLFKSFFFIAMVAMMVCGFSACSDDDEPGGGKKGKFSGWVEVDGQTYNFVGGFGYVEPESTDIEIVAFSKDFYSIKEGDLIDQAYIDIEFNEDGTWRPYASGYFPFDIEVDLGFNTKTEDCTASYATANERNPTYEKLSISKDGNKLYIDGKNYVVVNLDTRKKTTMNFHFEGTPQDIPENGFEK